VAYATLNLLPFDSYAVAWDRRQILILGLYFGSAALPFFFHGWFTGGLLAAAGTTPGRAYAANLFGAAAGPPLALLTTVALRLEAAVVFSSVAGLAGTALLAERRATRTLALALALAGSLMAISPPESTLLRLSPNKPLAQARLYPDAVVTSSRDGVSGRLEVIESQGVHSYPGLSLGYSGHLPEQTGVYLDGDGPIPVSSLDPASAEARRLALSMPSGLAYTLRRGARALVLDPGSGTNAALSLAAGAAAVDVPVDEPLVVELLRGPYASYTFRLADDPRLHWLPATSRAALAGRGAYDVVEFALTDAFRPAASGAYSLTEDYLLTVEAVTAALQRLSPDGIVVLTRWLTTPPAESLRAWSTLLAAMDRLGIRDAGARLAAYRTLRTSTVLVSARPWSPEELETIRGYLERNGYDPIALPDLAPEELNRFNRIPDDPYPGLFQDLLEDRVAVERDYPYQIQPPTDDRPFFHHFFRWEQTPEILAAFGRTWQPFGGSGYLVLLALLALMLVLAAVLAASPALSRQVRGRFSPSGGLYFTCLGVGFMFIELSLLQRLTLPLERPAFAFAVVLSTLLLACGIGSRLSDRIKGAISLLLLASTGLIFAVVLPSLAPRMIGLDPVVRLPIAILMLVPIGILMGVPFPLGLRAFAGGEPRRVGWAWSINGAASGVAGVLAAMIAIDLGLTALMALGALAYFAAWLVLRRRFASRAQESH
jgi:hypothetical protein